MQYASLHTLFYFSSCYTATDCVLCYLGNIMNHFLSYTSNAFVCKHSNQKGTALCFSTCGLHYKQYIFFFSHIPIQVSAVMRSQHISYALYIKFSDKIRGFFQRTLKVISNKFILKQNLFLNNSEVKLYL